MASSAGRSTNCAGRRRCIPGDSLRVEIEILEARLSQSKPGYGLIRYRSLTKNQDDKVVQSFIALAILPTRLRTNSSLSR